MARSFNTGSASSSFIGVLMLLALAILGGCETMLLF